MNNLKNNAYYLAALEHYIDAIVGDFKVAKKLQHRAIDVEAGLAQVTWFLPPVSAVTLYRRGLLAFKLNAKFGKPTNQRILKTGGYVRTWELEPTRTISLYMEPKSISILLTDGA